MNFRIRQRLASRVAIAATALTVSFMLLMGGGAWLVTAQLIRAQVQALLQTEAMLRADKITDMVEGVASNFHALAGNAAIANALVDSIGRETYLRPLLADVAEVNGLRTTLTVTDFVGRPLVGSGPVEASSDAEPWVAAAIAAGRSRAKVAVTPEGPVLMVAEPVVYANTGTAEGALVWRVAIKELARRSALQAGRVSGLLRVEADGKVLQVRLGEGGDPPEQGTLVDVPVRLSPQLSVVHMSLLLEADRNLLDVSLTRLSTTFMAIGAVSTLLVMVLSVLLARRLTSALTRLADAATSFAFGSGDRTAFVMEGEDEIAQLGTAFSGMVERLDRAYRDLERRSQTLLSNAERVARIGSASWEVETGRHVWSDQFYSLLGLIPGEEEPTRAAFFRRVHPADRTRLSTAMETALSSEGEGKIVQDLRLEHPNGEHRVGLFRAEVQRDEARRAVRLDVTIQDITERKELEEKLDALVLELRRSNEELEQFAYVASHDLRQPLRTVRSYMTLIEEAIEDKLDGETREFMGFIRDGVRRMDSLITDLLAYSRVGRMSTDAPVDTGRAADLAIMDLQGEIDEAGAKITVPLRMPVVLGDAGEMPRLFQNLIGNAVKYRDDGRSPEVALTYHDRGEMWEFTVADNGIGISPEHTERVFGIFQRLHARDEYEGTGIGLAICRKVVERQGGRIWITEAQGGGTVFHFTWPKLKRVPEVSSAG